MTIIDLAAVALLNAAIVGNSVFSPDTSRPFLDLRFIVAVAPQADGFNVYWVHANELVSPYQPRLLVTEITSDGRLRATPTVVRDYEGSSGIKVAGDGALLQTLWTDSRTLRASPISNGILKFPDGKFVASWADYPSLTCHRMNCLASWETASIRTAVILDSDSNFVGAPFDLPSGFAPESLTLDEKGIFYVRHTLGELRGAMISSDGTVKHDAFIKEDEPLVALEPRPVAVAFDGSRHVVVFLEHSAESSEVRAVVISEDGSASLPIILFRGESTIQITTLEFAWNGSSYLLAGGYVNGLRSPFLYRFDEKLRLLDTVLLPAGAERLGPPQIQVLGSNFLFAWSGLKAYVAVMSADGQISQPVAVDALERRRAVRR
jgi:hypothetical protein